jgi:addiction module HigA family antidote
MKVLANHLTPFMATHPGELLKEEIEFRNLSQQKLAEQLGVSHSVLNEILNSKRPIDNEFALLIEAALGIEASLLTNLQNRYDLNNPDSALSI